MVIKSVEVELNKLCLDYGINMSEHPLSKVSEPDDPNRCQGIGKNGQCWNRSVDHGTHCLMHGGNKQENKYEKQSREMYQVDMFKARIIRQRTHTDVKTLGNEIAILRMLLEGKLNACTSDVDLMLASPAIGDLVTKIEKVVTSCHKLEKAMGQHLDKSAILQFAGEVVNIINQNVTDKHEVKLVADAILKMIGDMGNEST